jgi:hypothetical protein
VAYFFILAGIVLRLIPHIPNFAPIAAMALFGGVYLNNKYSLVIPLVALLIGDIFIGFYNPVIMISVYGSFLLIGLLGLYLKKHKSASNVIGASLLSSILFFIITNFTMWAIPHSLYPHNFSGLLNCYTLALPFFKNTIYGDLFYTVTMFSLMEMVILLTNKHKEGYAKRFIGLGRG